MSDSSPLTGCRYFTSDSVKDLSFEGIVIHQLGANRQESGDYINGT
jgi:hypothetical protein